MGAWKTYRWTGENGVWDPDSACLHGMTRCMREEAVKLAYPKVVDAELAAREQAAARAREDWDAFQDSMLRLLSTVDELRLVTDMVWSGDALCLALTCKPFRDAIFCRFLPSNQSWPLSCSRLQMVPSACVLNCRRLRWAWLNGYPRDAHIPEAAARAGNLAVLQQAFWSACPWDERTCTAAAQGGHLAVLQWAREHGCPWGAMCLGLAARAGHLAVLEWAAEQGCPLEDWDGELVAGGLVRQHPLSRGTFLCREAAAGGHLHVLQWARAHGCPWGLEDNLNALSDAAERGDLTMLQWAHAAGAPSVGTDVCCSAAGEGHLHVLRWARENGFPWDSNTTTFARDAGHTECLEWALANGCEPPWAPPLP